MLHQPTLAHLIAMLGDTQVMVGSDYPYLAGQGHPGHLFEELDLAGGMLKRLRVGNARRFLEPD